MRAYASSLHAWKSLERQEGIKVPHGLVFPLAVVGAIGKPHGLEMDAEEHHPEGPAGYDAVFITVLDSRCMVHTAEHFRTWGLPLRRRDRDPSMPLVWAGGQGLHNPLPYQDVADLIVIGDAEDPLPGLLRLQDRHGNSPRFLGEAAAVPGVYVPSVHDPARDVITQSVAQDIGITLREQISVSHDGTARYEGARGCRFKCTFCSLGHRTPYRENPAQAVIAAIGRGPARVHVQAGDIESHSGIVEIRRAIGDRGALDQSWTGRLDSLLERIDPLGENPDAIPGHKRYALGVEAPLVPGQARDRQGVPDRRQAHLGDAGIFRRERRRPLWSGGVAHDRRAAGRAARAHAGPDAGAPRDRRRVAGEHAPEPGTEMAAVLPVAGHPDAVVRGGERCPADGRDAERDAAGLGEVHPDHGAHGRHGGSVHGPVKIIRRGSRAAAGSPRGRPGHHRASRGDHGSHGGCAGPGHAAAVGIHPDALDH